MKQSNREIIQRYYQQFWNNKKLELAREIFAEDLVFRGSLGIETNGIEEFLEYVNMLHNTFGNLYHAVEDIISEGNKSAARVVYNGEHIGKLFDIEPTNRRIRYAGSSFFYFEDEKISRLWVLGDLNTLFNQIK